MTDKDYQTISEYFINTSRRDILVDIRRLKQLRNPKRSGIRGERERDKRGKPEIEFLLRKITSFLQYDIEQDELEIYTLQRRNLIAIQNNLFKNYTPNTRFVSGGNKTRRNKPTRMKHPRNNKRNNFI